ncbi:MULTISPECIES: hypothetical protein [Kitasatospora]|uniref:Uncharacterized protein n=1 Tax=Kitasatospora setae (strain ATCC 33774 / DSM 43861 / JCM 3304 / KCC A-0304 / NBRC 14216 / KM-6054) TaxID=452652 RepID=E4NIS2_KITSK|nr:MULTISPECIES: hypothetical protein [Kitasatospora]BAJ32870.1 hypothetical protein KSE_71140 [Kitasatospora setae KM-6054]
MTIQREAPARADDEQPPAGHRAAGERRRLAVLWSVVAVLAAGGVWVVATPKQSAAPAGQGGGDKPAASAAVGQPVPPLTESQSFLSERYFPSQRAYEYGGYRARRSAARDGADCRAVQNDKTRDVLAELGCQGWLGIALTRADQPVISSVTVLRFLDPEAAAKALQAIRDKAGDFEFTYPDGLFAPAGGVRPMAAARVDLVGHHLTVTVTRYVDQRPGDGPDALLTASNRSAAAAAGQPFMWMQ